MGEHTHGSLTIAKSTSKSWDEIGDTAIVDSDGFIIGEAFDVVGRKTGPVKGDEGNIIGHAVIPGEYIHRPSEANARLWAASPALLEACEAALRFIDNGVELGYITMPTEPTDPALKTAALLEAAIKKAEGTE